MSIAETEPTEHVDRIRGADLHYWVYRPTAGSGSDTGEPRPVGAAAGGSAEDPVPVVMIHGLRGTHHGLEAIAGGLRGRYVVVPDLPGFGDSPPMAGTGHDVEGYAGAVVELLERLGGGTRPVDLLGHSFGSLVAAHVASVAPRLVRRLALVNPISTPALRGPRAVLSRLTSGYYRLGKVLPERAGRALLSSRWIVLATGRAMLRTRDPRLRRFVHDSHLRHFSRFHSPALLVETYDASVSHTVVEYADSLTMPTLLVAGETDDIAPLAGQQRLHADLAESELVVLPEVGHLVHYEKPATAAREVERFLES